MPDCNATGTGCTITIVKTVATGSSIASIGGGFVLRVEDTNMYAGLSLPSESTLVNRSIVFPLTTTVTIDDSPSYPSLNGRIIDVSGVATDVNGGYSVFFLP